MTSRPDVTADMRPRAIAMNEALPHAANRVRLAKAEQRDAVLAVMRAKDALKAAEDHLQRCDGASAHAVDRLARLAETGRVDAYCRKHDLFYTFAPVVPKQANGAVDHFTTHDERFLDGGIPPCPECSAPMERMSTGIQQNIAKGASDASRQNWIL